MRIYFAGPLFAVYERDYIARCAARLRAAGIACWVPHEQLAQVHDVTAVLVYQKDSEGLAGADAMVAILDGAQVDDGTACEIGIFATLMQADPTKKGIVGLLTDLRSQRLGDLQEGKGVNLFVLG